MPVPGIFYFNLCSWYNLVTLNVNFELKLYLFCFCCIAAKKFCFKNMEYDRLSGKFLFEIS